MVTERETRWQELTYLLNQVDRGGIAALTAREVKRMASLYRQVSIDLSQARAREDDPERIHYLNLLAARAHGRVYATKKVDTRPIVWFLLTGFAQLLRKRWRPVAIATAAMFLPAIASTVAIIRDPEIAYSLFDPNMVEFENLRIEKQQGQYKGNFTFDTAVSHAAAAGIIANNCFVAIRSFAFGALFCVPGLLIMIYNGQMLGTYTGVLYNGGYAWDFYTLILTHGVLELSALCIAGGAGVHAGWALVAPGARPRSDALKSAAKDAFGLLAGSLVMLVFAGIIEAYVTPHYPAEVRLIVAGTTAILFGSYVAFAGRSPTRISKGTSIGGK